MSIESALITWANIKAGQKVIVSDETLDILSGYFSPKDTDEAAIFFGHLVSEPNPKRIGIRDQYIAYIR